ncbi:hypothetical protein H2200_012562 [Cladophialophora chaetospira]|uniref:Cytochrome P450 n=1 Tax=Cladophialophora chaetospira TaxID=386627 RepID=A0AA39CC26_9EURO|nr:hypothetical protein H2200_012562 [Cladophialophora chaetospira]
MSTIRIWLYCIAIPIVFVLARRTYNLYNNYCTARKLGIAIVVAPIGWQDDAWLLCWQWFTWMKRIPFVDSWFDYSRFSWTQDLRHRPHQRLGDAFAVVTPNGVEIMLNDPQAVNDLQTKYRNWFKPAAIFDLFNTFGKSVVTVNGDDWQRHRRIVNPAFQEQANKLVWDEGRRQARHMLKSWAEKGNSVTIDDISRDCVVIALHVLSAAGFGQTHDFQTGVREVPSGHYRSFSDTMSFLLQNSILVLLFESLPLPNWALPRPIRNVKNASADFKLYMREAIAYTKGLIHGGSTTQTAEMVTTLIKGNEAAKHEQKASGLQPGAKPTFLSDDEVLGNLYILNIAGFETTANALTYAIPYLATNPEVQDWLHEEVDEAWKQSSSDADVEYESTFPKLTRCLAVLYETLRMWTPVSDSARWASGESQVLKVGDKEIVVPSGVIVSSNNYGVHSDPRWWGEDSLEWKPKRWIMVDPDSKKEVIAPPPPGAAFVAWSVGPRICPGKKFSQVEFTAVLSLLVANYRLEPLLMAEKGMKTKDDGRKAILDVIWASHNMLTPKMGRGKEAGVALVKR